jgi:DNA polymerase (family 10)
MTQHRTHPCLYFTCWASSRTYGPDRTRLLQAQHWHGVAVEINCNPNRLELDWRWHRRALELGCRLSINPDAELELVRWGMAIARKGGVPKERVLNAMDLAQLMQHLRRRRQCPAGKVAQSIPI